MKLKRTLDLGTGYFSHIYFLFLFLGSYLILLTSKNAIIFSVSSVVLFFCFFTAVYNFDNKLIFFSSGKVRLSIVLAVVMSGLTFFVFGFVLYRFGLNNKMALYDFNGSLFFDLCHRSLYFFIFSFVVFSPVVEEVIFRKFLLRLLKNKIGVFSTFLTSFCFAILHEKRNVGEYLFVFVFSLQANEIYSRFGKLYLSILFHVVFNFSLVFVFLFFEGRDFNNGELMMLGGGVLTIFVLGLLCTVFLNFKIFKSDLAK